MTMERREFLKVIGAAGAGAGLFGCSTQGPERLLPYVIAPEDVVPGVATWFRTTCRECPAGCGMDIRTREGRAVKAEGNPLSPIGHGRLCARGQASLHGLYNPDRIPQALARAGEDWEAISWDEAEQRLVAALQQAGGRTVFLTSGQSGTMDRLLDEWTAAFGIERVRFDPFALEPLRAANRLLFGQDVLPSHDFSNADVVVSFGADFLETWLSPVDYAHGFTRAHAYANGRRGRFVWVGPHQSLTGLNADDWLPARPGTEHLVALAMARVVADQGGQAGPAAAFLQQVDVGAAAEQAGVSEERIRQIARAFANGGRSLAVGPGVGSSSRAATALAAAVALLNYVAGNIGRTVRLDRPELGSGGSYQAVRELFARMGRGEIGALLVYGPNPLYSVPLDDDAAAALERVPFVASFNTFPDETSSRAHLLLPDHHFLESWGDYVPRPGVYSLVQPVMNPVFQTKQTGDVLLSVARRAGVALPTAAATFYDYLRETWQRDVFPRAGALPEPPAGSAAAMEAAAAQALQSPFENWWRRALQLGVVTVDTPAPAAPPQLSAAALAQLDFAVPEFSGGEGAEYHLIVYPSYRFYDGQLANRPWLQELPDPISKLSWTSWVEVNPETAERLGLVEGSIAEVETPNGRAELLVWPHPGIRPDTIAIQLGQGHEALGRYAQNRGVNAARLLAPEVEQPSGGLVWQQTRAALRNTGRWERPPESGNATQAGREIARAMTLEEARRAEPVSLAAALAPARAEARGQEAELAAGHGEAAAHPMEAVVQELQGVGGFGPAVVPAGPQDYPPPGTHYGEYTATQPRWAMAIDLERCIGCSACVTACYAENNIGIVGPDQIRQGRILHWIRIERYFYGHEEHGEDAEQTAEAGEYTPVRFIPMLCQHCGNAPCEPVCPVYAAYHTPDGLNGQIYNRCVGTRYCANNCPYKVRYFNWYTWEWPEPLNWQLNPDVTVREKGVMEKCTFCVQRIRDAEHRARLEGRSVPDGEIVPACAQTCPGEAIVFGNIKDPNSRVARIAASGRGYRVLEELNTQSGIVYLQQVLPEGVEA
jgi:molybdopterin-containing oxidoreductase family iron-sulfur binding subunit